VKRAESKPWVACSARHQLREVGRTIGVRSLQLDRCEPGEQLAELLRALDAKSTRAALKRVERLKRLERQSEGGKR
jgi:hypothetical protein